MTFKVLLAASLSALAASPDRIPGALDNEHLATLPGHTITLAQTYRDAGPLEASQPVGDLMLFLKPSPGQQAELDQLLTELQDPSSPLYHQWLTPEQYADRFGVSASDAAKITGWLESQGFEINWVGRGRSQISFRGTAGAVEAAFDAGLRGFVSQKARHYANTMNPKVPEALREIIGHIGGLDDFRPEPDQHPRPATTNGPSHSAGPDDLAAIYDFASLLANGIDGTGQKIVVVGESDIVLSDLTAYRANYNLPAPNVQVILIPGSNDPGVGAGNGTLNEADLDLELVSGIARNATIIYVNSTNAYSSLTYAIDQNLAPVATVSYHLGCDASVSASSKSSYQSLAQQGNAQGITWINSSGDIGAAGCDSNGVAVTTQGLAARFPADIPEVTAVGGTELSSATPYWATTNGPHGGSALGYVPETAWNTSTPTSIAASSGAPSTAFAKPAWQAGPGVPADGQRDVPDVAVSAGETVPYLIVSQGVTVTDGETSAAAPVFAGMMVLLNHYLVSNGIQAKPGLGNLNALLYRLAQSNPTAFHDITSGNNFVPCQAGSLGCVNGELGYSAGPGWDFCTGLGSIDLANLAAAAGVKPAGGSAITVSSSANPVNETLDSTGAPQWKLTLTLTETNGVATTLTGVTIDGKSYPVSTWFTSAAVAASGHVSTSISFGNSAIPGTHTFAFAGADTGGRTWTTSLSVQFVGFATVSGPVPAISGSTNAASFAQTYAPGMILSIFGSNLASGTQAAATVPLALYSDSFEATVNGVLAPIYYVSPTQANVQIPYGTAPGAATLTVYQGSQSATSTIQIASAAPGIFADGSGNTVPYTSGSAGQTLVLFITGDGEVTPTLATGTAPASTTPLGSLPQSVLPVSMTIGGQPAQIVFHGIPYGLVGVTQINFVVPSGLAPGPQPVVVTVGTAASKPATFTIQ